MLPTIMLAWAGSVSEGMLPNRFPDAGEAAEFNAVDASQWFVIAAHELLASDQSVEPSKRPALHAAIGAILDGYARGPHAPGGCPFQAWSLGEALRLDRAVLASPTHAARTAAPRLDKPAMLHR